MTSRRWAPLVTLLGLAACRSPHKPPRRTRTPIPVTAPTPSTAPAAAWTTSLVVPVAGSSTPLEVTVHVPARLDRTKPIYAVVFFHAATVCAAEFVWTGDFDQRLCHRRAGTGSGWAFSNLHDLAHTNTVLVVPQLHSGRDGALGRPAGLPTVLDAVARRVGEHLGAPVAFAGTVFGAHSLGGHTLQKVLAFPSIARDVRAVLLYDALGDRADVVLPWWQAPDGESRRLLMIYGGVPSAMALAHALMEATRHRAPGTLVTRVGDLTRDLRAHPMVFVSSRMPHGSIPFFYFTKSLAALGLPTTGVVEPWESAPPSAPIVLRVGETVSGRLTVPNATERRRYRDYAVALTEGQCAGFTLTGGAAQWSPRGMLDTRLQLWVDGAVVADDDDGAGVEAPGEERFDSRARWCAPGGGATVVARVSARLGNWSGGAFTLGVR